MDLKRVELAAYNGLPHLLVPVITEPERAKAALNWAVNEMEDRYRRLAGATARNIRAFNDTPGRPRRPDALHRHRHRRAGRPDDARGQERRGSDRPARPEGARDGHPHGPRHAAALGQRRDRPDQGQLPEPDRLRDGLPDRLADDPRRARRGGPHRSRRHALPAVGPAPPDAPPGRLRVATPRSAGSSTTGRTRSTTPITTWPIIETGEEGHRHAPTTSTDEDADRLLPDAIEVIREYDRASASLLQRRLKVGYARAPG